MPFDSPTEWSRRFQGPLRRVPRFPHPQSSFVFQFFLSIDFISFLASLSQYPSSTPKFFLHHLILLEKWRGCGRRRTTISSDNSFPLRHRSFNNRRLLFSPAHTSL